jgi:succinyl-diaminopimelate desuccinylase
VTTVPPPDAPVGAGPTGLPSGDLLELTAALIDVASPSFAEDRLCGLIHAELAGCGWLEVERVGDNVVARTHLGRARRLVLAGHTDTVPANGNEIARIEGDRLWGVGAADMKGGLAVMLELARTVAEPVVDVTWVFYAREEVAADHSGLGELFALRPDLLVGDVALLGEPTSAALEAGCQGTLRAVVALRGERAHTARPWMGRNAVHRLADLLAALAAHEGRRPVVDGLEFRESTQAVAVSGGVAGNVVPDLVELTINHRFAPDRTIEEAVADVAALVGPFLEDGDTFDVVDAAAAAWPAVSDPLVASLVARRDLEVRAKLGWTDASRFAAAGIPAANYGPGDATIAHTAGEHVDRASLEAVHAGLTDLLTTPLS